MSTMHPPDPGSPQTPATSSPSKLQSGRLHPFVRRAGLLLAFYLLGPMIFYAHTTQVDTAGSSWQAEKRWAIVNGKAIASLLWYLPIVVFHSPLAAFWTAIFVTLAHGLHLPFLAWLGGTTIFPPVPSSTLLRWLLACPLAGLLTLGLEAAQPRTVWESKRVITAEEQQELNAIAAAQEKKRLAKAQRKLKATQQAATSAPSGGTQTPKKTSPRPRKPRAPATPKEKAGTLSPKADSLWGQIDWSAVPADHPLKRAVREEAERLEAERLEQNRKQWLTQQQAAHGLTTSLQIVDAAPPSPPVSPSPPAPPPVQAETADAADEQYDWDEGEGSIQA